MFQRSIRAPNLVEAFLEQFTETLAYVGADPTEDPCSASADPIGNGYVDNCVATGLPENLVGTFEATVGIPTDFIRGGNPDLTPETAETFTLGAIVTFGDAQSWQISVDYFDLEVEDTIGELVSTVVCFDPANTENVFCDTIRRDQQSGNYDVIEVFEPFYNRGVTRTSGFDTQVFFQTDLPGGLAIASDHASLSINAIWTHTIRNSIQEISFGTALRCGGRFGFPCDQAADGQTYPENRVMTNFDYIAGDLSLHLSWRWIDGTENAFLLVQEFFGGPPPNIAVEEIGSKSYVDFGAGYQFSDRIHARLNVSNLLETEPPQMAWWVTSNNTDTRMYDVFGRSYTLSLSLRY